jgi:hypothetical protein
VSWWEFDLYRAGSEEDEESSYLVTICDYKITEEKFLGCKTLIYVEN